MLNFRKFLENTQEYLDAKAIRDGLEKDYKEKSLELKKFDVHRNSSGLLPEEIRVSKEYQEKKKILDIAFKKLQDFNAIFTKKFKKEIRDERRSN